MTHGFKKDSPTRICFLDRKANQNLRAWQYFYWLTVVQVVLAIFVLFHLIPQCPPPLNNQHYLNPGFGALAGVIGGSVFTTIIFIFSKSDLISRSVLGFDVDYFYWGIYSVGLLITSVFAILNRVRKGRQTNYARSLLFLWVLAVGYFFGLNLVVTIERGSPPSMRMLSEIMVVYGIAATTYVLLLAIFFRKGKDPNFITSESDILDDWKTED